MSPFAEYSILILWIVLHETGVNIFDNDASLVNQAGTLQLPGVNQAFKHRTVKEKGNIWWLQWRNSFNLISHNESMNSKLSDCKSHCWTASLIPTPVLPLGPVIILWIKVRVCYKHVLSRAVSVATISVFYLFCLHLYVVPYNCLWLHLCRWSMFNLWCHATRICVGRPDHPWANWNNNQQNYYINQIYFVVVHV